MHVNVVCQPSVELVRRLAERTVDLALVTEGSGERGGTLLCREQLVWVSSATHRAHELDPLPLATFEPGCPFRRAAMESLAAAAAPTGSPTPASASPACMPRSRPVSRSA